MSNSYALVRDGVIENVALVDDGTDGGRAYLDAIAAGYDAVIKLESPASPGQHIGGDGKPVPRPELTADRNSIPGDGATAATITYTNREPDAPKHVAFTVNGDETELTLTSGSAAIAVTSATPGDTITVKAGELTLEIGVTDA